MGIITFKVIQLTVSDTYDKLFNVIRKLFYPNLF